MVFWVPSWLYTKRMLRLRIIEMEFALDLFGPDPITWRMTVFSNNLITMKILSVVWILDYPNPLLLIFFFGAPHGIGLIEVVLCDSFGMKALKLKWAKVWPFLLMSDSLGKNIRLLFWVISLQILSWLWIVVMNDLTQKFWFFFLLFFWEFKVFYCMYPKICDQITADHCFATNIAVSGPGPKSCVALGHNQSLWWSFGSRIDRRLQLVMWDHVVSSEEQYYW